MKTISNKIILIVLAIAVIFAAFPATAAFAQEQTPPKPVLTDEKLAELWAKESEAYERMGKLFTDSDERIAKAQELIDNAKANGKNTSELQTALDNFAAALKKAKPIYESMNGIFASHQGFDANGKVTDSDKAKETLKQARDKFGEIKSALGGTGKAFAGALEKFRAANKPAEPKGRD